MNKIPEETKTDAKKPDPKDKDKDNDDKKPGGGNAAGGTPGGEVWSWESASVLSLLSEGGDFIVPALHLVSSFDAPFEVLFVSFSNLKFFSTTTLRCQYEKIHPSVTTLSVALPQW